jgi:hypothetical protein
MKEKNERYKAHLMTKGYIQTYEIDFKKYFHL